jgi:hypothetical protein
MEHLIAQFLIQYNICPLPGIGTLERSYSPASLNSEHAIWPPSSGIILSPKESSISELIHYIRFFAAIKTQDAETALADFCASLHAIRPGEKIDLSTLGKFQKDEAGRLSFNQTVLNAHFYQELPIEKIRLHVIEDDCKIQQEELVEHAEDTLTIEETADESTPPQRSFWWIWAIAFIVLAIGLCAYHFLNNAAGNPSGNSQKIEPAISSPTYQNIP